MQVQKDVLIAGGVVVVCVALVVVALVATGKKDQPVDPTGSSALTDNYGTSSSAYDGTSYGSQGSTGDSFGSAGLPPPGMPGDMHDMGMSGTGGNTPFSPSGMGSPAPIGMSGGVFDQTPSPITPSPAYGTQGDAIGAAPVSVTPIPATSSAGGGTHTVVKGETLGDISATHYGTTKHWRKIVEANPGLDPARLKIGQVIQIPAVENSAPALVAVAGGADTHTVRKGESYYTIAKKELGSASRWREIERLNGIPAESLKVGTVIKLPAKDQAASPGTSSVGGGKTHIVSKGETLGDISKEYFGTTTKWKQIVEANPGVRPENLKVGQSLIIPDVAVSAPGATATGGGSIGGNAYTVKAGDTLESIAAATLGKRSAWKQIVEANPGLQPTALRIGQSITIPGGVPAQPAAVVPITPIGPSDFAPIPGGMPAPGLPAPAPQPTFQDDPFYSPYDTQPAAPAPRPLGQQPAVEGATSV